MRRYSILFFFTFLIYSSLFAQNSGFSTTDSDQCPGNLFNLTADDNSLVSYDWTITEQGGGSSFTFSANPIAFVLANPGLYDVTLTVSDGSSTSTTTEIGFLEVFSNPVIDYTVSPAPYCEPATVDFTSNSSAGSGTITEYQIFTDGTAYTSADFQHTYASTGTYSVNVTIVNSNGCVATQDLADIEVNENPALTSPLNPNTICSGSVFNYTPTSSISGSSFSWARVANPDIAEAPTSGIGNISETLTNTSSSDVAVTYQVTTTAPSGCAVTEDVVVTVQAIPTVTVNSLNICIGQSGTLTATPSVGGGNYFWSTTETTQSITVSSAGTYTVTYSVGSCSSVPVDATVTESSPPVLTGISVAETSGLVNDDGTMCTGSDNAILTANPTGGSGTYTWSNGSNNNPITVSPNTTTTYSVTYEEGGCTSAPVSQTIVITNLPSNNYTSSITNACSFPVTTDYSSTTAAASISWDFPGGSPATGTGNGPISVTYSASGIYDITMTSTSSQGCVSVTNFPNTIAVGNGFPPTSSFTTSTPVSQCIEGNSFCFEYTGNGADTVEWDFGDGSSILVADENQVVCHTYASLGTFTIVMTPYTTIGNVLGCSGITSQMDVDVLGPQAGFTISALDCNDQLTRTYTSTSVGTSPTTLYTWDFDDPPSPPVTGVSSTTYTFSAYSPSTSTPYVVTLTVEDPATGCPPNTISQNVYAFPNNTATFETYTTSAGTVQEDEICLEEELWFINETPQPQSATNPSYTQWDWNITNGYQWQTGSQFTGSPEDLIFSETSSGSSGNQSWSPGTYDIAMRTIRTNPPTGGTQCYDTVVRTVTVHGILGGFTIPDTVCIGQSFTAVDASTAPMTSIVQRDWDWDNDGVIDLSGNDPSPTHSFPTNGLYTVSLTCTDAFGCTKTTTQQIAVRNVFASFDVDRTFICDDETVTITANNSTCYGPLTYDWVANTNVTPGTSTALNPGSFLFNDEGDHTITLTVTDNLGCTDDTTMTIQVYDVIADGSGTPNLATCFNPPTVVSFTNLSSNNVDPSSVVWDFGNGQTATDYSPSTIYTTAGTFDVTLTVSSLTGGCTSSVVVETITVQGPFGLIAVTNPVLDGCSCFDASIDVTTSDVAEATLLFGDGSFQTLAGNTTETVVHSYCNTGSTTQTLTPILYVASGTCNGNILANESVTIYPNPTVDNPGNVEYCEGENSAAINFTGNIGTTTYNWTNDNTDTGLGASGTGDISSFLTQNLDPGMADEVSNITVTPVVDATGCTGTPETFAITVKKAPTVNAGVDDVICEVDDFTLNGTFGGGASSAQWSGGSGTYVPDDQDMNAVYTPSAGEIVAGSVTFTLTTDDPAGVCDAVSDDMVLTINPGVTVDAGPDMSICSDNPQSLNGVIGGSASSGLWSSSGSGTFDDPSNLNATYTPSAADITAGSVTIYLATDNPSGPCFANLDSLTLTISEAATISVTTPLESCIGTQVQLNAVMGGTGTSATWSNGSGAFSPNANDLNPLYSPTNAENALGTVSLIITVDDPDGAGPCLAVSDQVDVTLNDTVTVSAGVDATICSNDSILLNGVIGGSASSALWTSSGTGTFDDATNLNAYYTPSAADLVLGSVTLTLTTDDPAGPCLSSFDDMVLSFSPAAVVDITQTSTGSCNDATVTINSVLSGTATSILWSGGGGIYSPNSTSVDIDYTPTVGEIGAGGLWLFATTNDPDGAGPCPAGIDSIEIVIATDVLVDAGPDSPACSNVDIQLNGSIGGAATSGQWSGGSGTFTPDDTDLNALYTPTPAEISNGSVTLTLTTDDPAGPCIALSDDVTFTFEAPATADAGSDGTVCSNGTYTLSGAFGGTASSASWSTNGTGTFDDINLMTAAYTPSAADLLMGVVTLTITTDDPAGACDAVSDDMLLTINEEATLTVTSPLDECIGETISLGASIGGSGTTVTWSNGGGLFVPDVNTVAPDYIPSALENSAGTATLIITVDDPDGAGPCTSISDQIDITLYDTVIVSAGPDGAVCSDDSYALTGTMGGSASSILWTTSGTGTFDDPTNVNAVYTPSAADLVSGSVVLTLTTDDPAGPCSLASDDMVLTISEAATITTISPVTECIGVPVSLTAVMGGSGTNSTWSNGGGTYTPSNNNLTPDYTPTTAENAAGSVLLIITVADPDGTGPCLSVSDQVDVTLNDTVSVSAGSDATICSDDLILLTGVIGGSATSSTWTTSGSGSFDNANSLNAVYTPSAGDLSTGSVTLTLTTDDPSGPCPLNSDDVVFTFVPVPTADAGLDQDICSDQTVSLTGSIGGSATSLTWSSSGTGTFDNTSNLNVVYTPSVADLASGSVTISLSTDDPSGVCGITTDNMLVTFFPFATANAGVDQSICSDSDAVLSGTIGGSATSVTWTSSGSGTFTPDANTLNATYVTSLADQAAGFVVLTMTTNDPIGPCPAVSDEMELSISAVPTVNAGTDIVVCAGFDAQLNGTISGAVITGTWSGGAGTFNPSATDLNATYTPTASELSSGSVTLTLTSDDPIGPCLSVSDDVLVSFSTPAIVSAGSDEVICEGEDVVLNGSVGGSAVSADWSGSTGTFAPGTGALNATFTPSAIDIANGSVVLTITSNDPAGPCTAVTDDVLITINPTPVLSSASTFDACSGAAVDYDITSAVPSNFSWVAESNHPSLSGESLTAQNSSTIDDILVNSSGVSQTINYLVTATALGSGCVNADQVVAVTVNLITSMNTPADQTVCYDENTADIIFTASDPTLTYSWTNDNDDIGLALSGTGDILSFTALNTSGVVQVATITVTPSLNGCPGSPETFTITVNPNSTVNDPPDLIACDGQLTSDVIFTGSDPAITYSWTNTNGTIGLGLSGAGDILAFTAQNVTNVPVQATITVTPTLNACIGTPEQFDITVNPSPEMTVPADQTTCVNNNTADIIFSSNVTGAIYTWSNDNDLIGLAASGTGDIPSFTTLPTGSALDTATITVIPSFGGCPGPSVSFQIIITPILEVDPVPSDVFCAGEDFPGVSFTGNVSTTVYNWTNNNTSIGLPASGTGDISGFTLLNSGAVDQIATIVITPELSGCTAIVDSFTITVKPVPTVSVDPLTQTLCHDEPTLPVDFSGNITNADYDWDHTNVSIGLGTPGFGDIPSFTATNTSLIDETAIFTVTPSFNGCIGESENFTITVKPKPTVFPNADQVLCAGDITTLIGFDGNFGPGGATYNWTNDNIDIGLPITGSGDIGSFVATNTSADILTALIVVTPTFNGCDGIPDSITITVHPTPTVDPNPDQALCLNAPSDTVFFTGNIPLTTNYNWTNDNTSIGLAGSGTGDIPSFDAQGNPSTVTIATIIVTPELNGCVGISDTFTITTIDPIPIVLDPADQTVCEGDSTVDVIFTGPNPVTSFIWSNNNITIGLPASGTGDILSFPADNTFLVDQTAIITVTPEYNGCEGTSQDFTITVKPAPEAFVDPALQELCSGEVTDEIFFTSDLAGAQFDWTNDNASIGLTGPGTGDISSFTVTNTSTSVQTATISVVPTFNGCAGDTATATIIVNPVSTVVVSSGIDEYCHNDPTIDYLFSGSSGSSTYTWTNTNISIGLPASGSGDILSFTATNTDLVNQLATITVAPVLNGCVGVQQVFQILVKPIPTVDPVLHQNICANENTDAIVFDGTMQDSTLFIWTNDNTSIGLIALDTGDIASFVGTNISQDVQVANITVTPHLNSCIGTSEMISITVNPISTVNAIGDTVCNGEVVPQIDFVGNNASSVYPWTNDNFSIGLPSSGSDSIASFTGLNSGTTIQTANIIITPVVNGCPGINDTIQIQVNPTPIVYPVDDVEYCAEENTTAISFTGNMPSSNQYVWVNDLTAIGLSGAGIGDIPSFYTLNTGSTDLVANIAVTPNANGCVGVTDTFTITVHPLPEVYAGADTTLCFGQYVTLTATGAISYSWDNGVINGVPFYPTSTLTYHVVGTDANLCQNEDSVVVTYLLDIPPVVDAGPDQEICFSEEVTLTASGDAILYQWNNGVLDGVPFSPAATNSYVVIGTAINGCIEADTVEVVVHPLPVVTANASDDFLCDGESTILWGEGANVYIWDQGVLDSVSFVPPATSTYTVIGYDLNGCTDTTDIEIIVNPLPNVLFSTDMTYGGCVPFSPTFTDLTDSPASSSVLWDFGNGASSTQMGSVINTYDSFGCYDVTLISTTAEGCTDSLTQEDFVCVNPVIASFYPDVYEQSVINPIFEFTNQSVNAASFEWFFGDGTESDFVNTTHFYESYGVYNVALVAMAEDGCTDTAYVAVTVNDELLFYAPNSFTPNGDGKNEIFLPVLTAGYDRDQGYVFSIYNRWGEEVFNTDVPGQGWDGTYNNVEVQNGTYIWYLKFKDSMTNQIHYRSGHVNVIK